MSDKEIVEKLIAYDACTIKYFFFVRCNSMLSYIGQYFCHDRQTPEELIGEFYEFLSVDDWHKLRIFKYTCSLNAYVTIIASRYFQHKRDKGVLSLDDNMSIAKHLNVDNNINRMFFMEDINRMIEKMSAFDRFLVKRILINGEKPGDILDDAEEAIKEDCSIKTNAQDRKQLAGYIYTRYNRARRALQKGMIAIGY